MPLSAGSEIKHHCTKCDLELWHTIIAMAGGVPARVKCNTCKSERNYKAPVAEGRSTRRANEPARPRASGSHPDFYQQKLRDSVMKTPKPYRADQPFDDGDVIDHIKFGRGVVLKLVYPDRMDVIFQDETKTLVRKAAS